MAVNMHLKLDGIDGDDPVSGHENEIALLAFSWGMSQSGTTHNATGGGAGKTNVQDISVTKYIDKASPTLQKFVNTGSHIASGVLTVQKAGGDAPVDYLKIELKTIMITSYTTGGSGGEDQLTENISLNFREFKTVYTGQEDTGGSGAAPEWGFNIATNKAA